MNEHIKIIQAKQAKAFSDKILKPYQSNTPAINTLKKMKYFNNHQSTLFPNVDQMIMFMIFMLLIFGFHKANAQAPKVYSDTVLVNATRDQLFSRAEEYFSKSNDTVQNQIKMKDNSLYRLVVQCRSVDHFGGNIGLKIYFIVYFTTSISIKDHVYKYIISDVSYDEHVTPVKAQMMLDTAVEKLKNAMAKKSNLDF